ncbi:Heparanase-like protein [Arachis hypogaea]|nr:Heparanase-like protein [Arachis hypogaea]
MGVNQCVKVALFLGLLVLFCPSFSSSEDVKLKVKGVTNIATTDENFICATLDWWPSNKCDYNQCPWGKAGILNLNLNNTILSNAIKAFNPLRIRLGSLLQDQIIYQFGKQKDCPTMKKKDNGLFGFRDWNPNNAISLMKYTVSKGYNIDSYEFGNELCSEGVSARIDSVQYAKDITKLRHIVNSLYPNATTRPKVLGPAGFYGKEWFDSFLQHVGPGVIDGVTHHIYNLGAGVDKDLISKVQDPYFLSKIAQTFKDVSTAVKEFTPWAGAWVGESGGTYNSGGKDVSHTFVNGFW